MKTWTVIIGIVVILAIVCSPALAISKADLIASYKGQSAPTIPIVVPIPVPTQAPGQITTFGTPLSMPASYPCIPASYYKYSKFSAPPEPTPAPIMSWEEFNEMMARVHYWSVFE
jgi:hypothetical protein